MNNTRKADAKIIISEDQITFIGFHIRRNYLKIYLENGHLYVCGSSRKYEIPNSVFIPFKNTASGNPYSILMINMLTDFFSKIPLKEIHFMELPVLQCYESVETIDVKDLPDDVAEKMLQSEAVDIINRYTEATSESFLDDCHINPETDILKFVYIPGGGTSSDACLIMDIPNNIYIALFAPYFGADKYIKNITGTTGLSGISAKTFIESLHHLADIIPYIEILSVDVADIYSDFITRSSLVLSGKKPGIIYIGKEQ